MIGKHAHGNIIIATGDVHKHHVGNVPRDVNDLASKPLASEIVTTSISSGGDGSDMSKGWENTLAENPHTKMFNDRRGYQVFTIGKRQWRTDLIAIDQITAPAGRKA